MSDATERTTSIARVKLYCATDREPVVSDADVGTIVDECARALTWVNNTPYIYGQVVRPTVDNGHFYTCVQAGTSAALLANEPDWPSDAAAEITDGVSDPLLTWREIATATRSIYNVPLAVHKVWALKAARASELAKLGEGNMQQVYDHCLQMMRDTAPLDFN